MKMWKRNAVVVAIVLFVGAAVYLNWSYNNQSGGNKEQEDGGSKVLGQSALVSGPSEDGGDDTQVSGSGEGRTTGTGYFATARLNRQQARDNALELLQQAAADEKADQAMVDEAIAANPQSVADYKAGKDKAIGFLVGQVMKKSRGKANPGMVNKLIIKTIKGE